MTAPQTARPCPLCNGTRERPSSYVMGHVRVSLGGKEVGKSSRPMTMTIPGPCEVCDGRGTVDD